jgi:hypothetical protein
MEKLKFLLKEKEKRARKIVDYRIDGSDRIWLKLYKETKEIQFNPNTQVIVLGGKVIEPMLSYAINSWNVMLPFITYRVDKEKVEAYIESIRYVGGYEKEDF